MPPPPLGQRTWIAVKVVDDDGKAIEGRPYQLKLTDGSERGGQTETGEIRVDDLAPGTCTFSLPVEGVIARSGRRALGGTGSSMRCLVSMVMKDSATNGVCPVIR